MGLCEPSSAAAASHFCTAIRMKLVVVWKRSHAVHVQYAGDETKAKIEEILSPAFEAVVGVIGALILWCREKFSGAYLLFGLPSCVHWVTAPAHCMHSHESQRDQLTLASSCGLMVQGGRRARRRRKHTSSHLQVRFQCTAVSCRNLRARS